MKDKLAMIAFLALCLLLAGVFYVGMRYERSRIKIISSDTTHTQVEKSVPISVSAIDTASIDSLKKASISWRRRAEKSETERRRALDLYDSIKANIENDNEDGEVDVPVAEGTLLLDRIERVVKDSTIALKDTARVRYEYPPVDKFTLIEMHHEKTPVTVDSVFVKVTEIREASFFDHVEYFVLGAASFLVIDALVSSVKK